MNSVKEGDIVLELNGESMLGVGEEEWAELRMAEYPWRLVVGRRGDEKGAGEGEMKGLQQDIALIQSRYIKLCFC